MNLNDLKKELSQNVKYSEAERKLAANFHFANAVLRARLKRGWSQTELARHVGTRQANISRIEAGIANPTLDLIQRVCNELDLRIDFLEGKSFCEPITESSYRVDDQPGLPFTFHTDSSDISVNEETWP